MNRNRRTCTGACVSPECNSGGGGGSSGGGGGGCSGGGGGGGVKGKSTTLFSVYLSDEDNNVHNLLNITNTNDPTKSHSHNHTHTTHHHHNHHHNSHTTINHHHNHNENNHNQHTTHHHNQHKTHHHQNHTTNHIAQTTAAATTLANKRTTTMATNGVAKGGMGSSVSVRMRKSSVPIVSPHSLEIPPGYVIQNKSTSRGGSPARRRFSNVSDAVTRKISTTIGWRSVNVDSVITQAKCLVTQYIRCRLKRAGLLHKKLGLQRLRSVANLAGGWEVCEVFPRVSGIGQELERIYPKLYNSVARQLSISLTSDKVVRSVIVQVASQVFRGEVNWARIIALFAVAAGLASDCVKQGHPEYVAGVIDVMGLVTERHTAQWIASQGGWSSLLSWSQAPETESSVLQVLVLVVSGLIVAAFLLILSLKFLGELVT